MIQDPHLPYAEYHRRLRDHRIHQEKLAKIKRRKKGTGTLDNTMPATKKMPHLRVNLKRQQVLNERYADIERANRLLLAKMTHIMEHDTMDFSLHPGVGSLNIAYRKKELLRINNENQIILSRIQDQEPMYSASTWSKEWKMNKSLLKSICVYPYGGGPLPPPKPPRARRRGEPRSRTAVGRRVLASTVGSPDGLLSAPAPPASAPAAGGSGPEDAGAAPNSARPYRPAEKRPAGARGRPAKPRKAAPSSSSEEYWDEGEGEDGAEANEADAAKPASPPALPRSTMTLRRGVKLGAHLSLVRATWLGGERDAFEVEVLLLSPGRAFLAIVPAETARRLHASRPSAVGGLGRLPGKEYGAVRQNLYLHGLLSFVVASLSVDADGAGLSLRDHPLRLVSRISSVLLTADDCEAVAALQKHHLESVAVVVNAGVCTVVLYDARSGQVTTSLDAGPTFAVSEAEQRAEAEAIVRCLRLGVDGKWIYEAKK